MITRAGVFERKEKALLLLADLAIFFLSLYSVYIWRFGAWNETATSQVGVGLIIFFHMLSLYVFGAYEINPRTRSLHLAIKLGLSVLFTSVLAITYSYIFTLERSDFFGRGILFGSLLVYFVISGILRRIIVHSVRQQQKQSDWLFLVSANLKSKLENDLDSHSLEGRKEFVTELTMSELNKYLEKKWTAVIVALDRAYFQQQPELIDRLMETKFKGTLVIDLVTFYETLWRKVPLFYLGADWFVLAEGFSIFRNRIELKIKRLFDLAVAALLLFLTWPILLITFLAIKIEDHGPIFYRQTRTGKHGVPFTIFKLRSMSVDAEKGGVQWAAKNDSRVTKVGGFTRKTRIDELPQLWNVIKGDMSFVGPRPERPEIIDSLEKQIPFYNLRHSVQPGLTGWAQVKYPYGASVEDAVEKLQYDLYYIRSFSMLMDIKIFLHTVRVVLFGRGR
jgi:exopolysaccharide biosynthesis polyprenyl glycosylphosphotransferase